MSTRSLPDETAESTESTAPDRMPDAPPIGPGLPSTRPGRGLSPGMRSAAATGFLLVVLFVAVEVGVATELLESTGLPLPSEVLAATATLLGDGVFWADFGRTSLEVGASIVAGTVLGLASGILFWKVPGLGRMFEPYLVSFYAVPLVLFYPMMIVLVGINAASVIILSSIMAAIPLALNTRTGLMGIRPVFLKLARAVQCGPARTLFSVAIPAAAPMIVAGLRLAVVYALIGAIAMEFTTAQAGLGFRIRYLYETFDNPTMFAYIFVVLIISVVLTAVMALIERVLLKGRQ